MQRTAHISARTHIRLINLHIKYLDGFTLVLKARRTPATVILCQYQHKLDNQCSSPQFWKRIEYGLTDTRMLAHMQSSFCEHLRSHSVSQCRISLPGVMQLVQDLAQACHGMGRNY
jgi:hypothetical protein